MSSMGGSRREGEHDFSVVRLCNYVPADIITALDAVFLVDVMALDDLYLLALGEERELVTVVVVVVVVQERHALVGV